MKKAVVVLAAVVAMVAFLDTASAEYVDDGLVLYLDASNADGLGNPITSSTNSTAWVDLIGGNDAVYTGARADFRTAGVGSDYTYNAPTDPYAILCSDSAGMDDAFEFENLLNHNELSVTYEFYINTKTWLATHKGALIGESDGSTGYVKNYVQVQDSQYTAGGQVSFDQFYGSGDGSSNTTSPVVRDKWYHLVVTHDADTLTYYINEPGVESKEGLRADSMFNTETYSDGGGARAITKAWIVKRPEQYDRYEGSIALIRAYDRALTVDEVWNNYCDITGVPEPGTFALIIGALAMLLAVRRR